MNQLENAIPTQPLDVQQYQDQNLAQQIQSQTGPLIGTSSARNDAALAGLKTSFLQESVHELQQWAEFDTDPSFNAYAKTAEQEQQRVQLGMQMLSQDSREYLQNARSPAEYDARVAHLAEQKQFDEQMQANPVAALVGSFAGDTPLLVLGMGAGAVAGSAARAVGAGVQAANRAALAGDAVAAIGETALASFAVSTNNPNASMADVIGAALGVGIAGGSALRRLSKSKAIDEVLPETEQVVQKGTLKEPTALDTKLDAGSEHVAFTKINHEGVEVPVRIQSEAGAGRATVRTATDGTLYVDAAAGATALRVGATVAELVKAIPVEAITNANRILRAAKEAEQFTVLREAVRDALPVQEQERLATWLESDKDFVLGLQNPDFARTVQSIDDGSSNYLKDAVDYYAKSDANPNFKSDSLKEINEDAAITAERNALTDKKLKQNVVEKLLGKGNSFLGKHFSHWDRVAYAGDKTRSLANRLMSNAAATGSRSDSASDIKRTLELKGASTARAVNDSLAAIVKSEGMGVTASLFSTKKYNAALAKHADTVTRIMDTNAELARRGEPLVAVPEQYVNAVQALQDWSRSRREIMQEYGIEGTEDFSDWYIPRRYDAAETRAALAAKGITDASAVHDLTKQAFKDAFPDMSAEVVAKASKAMADRILGDGLSRTGNNLADLMSLSGDDVLDVLRELGVDDAVIDAVRESSKASAPALTQNLRRRTGLDTTTKYIVQGNELSLQDLIQKDYVSSTQQYDNALFGKIAMKEVGLQNFEDLDKAVREAIAEVPEKDRANWKKAVENAATATLTQAPGTESVFMRVLGSMASATMLRNSGIYQLADMGLLLMHNSAKATLKSLRKEAKEAVELMQDAAVMRSLNDMFEGAVKRDTKMASINQRIERGTPITGIQRIDNFAGNAASYTQTINGMRLVQKAQQGVQQHVMQLQLMNLMRGTGKDLDAARKAFREIGGLLDSELDAIRAAGDNALPLKLQQRLDGAFARMHDTILQHNRTGEYPHWVDWTATGRVLTGFAKFSLVSVQKVFRRTAQEHGVVKGTSIAVLYTLPWMIAAQTVMAVRDGRFTDKEGNTNWDDILKRSAGTLTVWGPATTVLDLFAGTGKANFGSTGFGYLVNAAQAPEAIVNFDEKTGSAIGKAVPFIGMIPGLTGALNYSFGNLAEQRDELLKEE